MSLDKYFSVEYFNHPEFLLEYLSDKNNDEKNLPVESVSWHEAVEFCCRLARKTGKDYRLPSESEWEYACRAGTQEMYHFGQAIRLDCANYRESQNKQQDIFNRLFQNTELSLSKNKTTIVGSYQVANPFGLFDMHGNVWEWCLDAWHNSYQGAPNDGSAWEDELSNARVVRGGSWYDSPRDCRSACRNHYTFDDRESDIGFRVVCSAPSDLS